jgi:hypothetical protein
MVCEAHSAEVLCTPDTLGQAVGAIYRSKNMKATETAIAWAAGLFEGEGCFNLTVHKASKVRRRPYPRAQLRMTDHDVVERFASVVEHGSITGPYKCKNPKHLAFWNWCWGGRAAMDWMWANFGPFLHKRRRAKLMEILILDELIPYRSEGFRRWARRIELPTKLCSRCQDEKLKAEFSSKSSSWCNTCKAAVEKLRRLRKKQAVETITAK